MDTDTFVWLLTPAGQELLAEAQAGNLSEQEQLRELTRLRRMATPERAAAAYQIAQARQRAAAKFSRAHAMYFTREALEQASGEIISRYRAQRYRPFAEVADLACGAGADTIALATHAHVFAVDRDPVRLLMARENARAYGVADRITLVQADLQNDPLPGGQAIFFDPARRSGGRRAFAIEDYQPPISLIRRWSTDVPAVGVKVAPGISDDELAQLGVLEVEFISVDGDLKEAVLWFGRLAGNGRRATVLTSPPVYNELSKPPTLLTETEESQIPLAEPGAYLYEPDPAVIRARALGAVAKQLRAAQIDPQIAYLTADQQIMTPFARAWRLLEWLPFQLKRLQARLRDLGAGAVTVKKRGSPLDTDALARRLSGSGARPLVVVLTFVGGRPAALICEGPLMTH